MNPQMKIRITQGLEVGRRVQRSPQPHSAPLQVWRPEMAPSVPRVVQEGTLGPPDKWQRQDP